MANIGTLHHHIRDAPDLIDYPASGDPLQDRDVMTGRDKKRERMTLSLKLVVPWNLPGHPVGG